MEHSQELGVPATLTLLDGLALCVGVILCELLHTHHEGAPHLHDAMGVAVVAERPVWLLHSNFLV